MIDRFGGRENKTKKMEMKDWLKSTLFWLKPCSPYNAILMFRSP